MPTYQYECNGCGHAFEILQSMTDKKLKKCPKCSKDKLVRLIGSGTGVIFKGSGFYETDYKKKEPAHGERPAKESSPAPKASPSGCGHSNCGCKNN